MSNAIEGSETQKLFESGYTLINHFGHFLVNSSRLIREYVVIMNNQRISSFNTFLIGC